VDDAARAYDADVRRRGWAHLMPLNFPQPKELAAYPQAGGERCNERGLPVSIAPEPPAGTQGAATAQGASGQRPPQLRTHKPSKSGFFGATKENSKKATPWRTEMCVSSGTGRYVVGYFATKKEAARAYDAEVRRRGWAHLKRLNFPQPADDAALPPSAGGGAPGHE